MIHPVSSQLRDALRLAHTTLTELHGESRRVKVNDAKHFEKVIVSLDTLTVAVQFGPARSSFIGMAPVAARYELSHRSPVTDIANKAAMYLQGEGQPSGLSQYEDTRTKQALDLLSGLYYVLVASIQQQAAADLNTLAEGGPDRFLTAVDDLGKWAHETA